ncbi:glycosyltransferase [Sporocytophaga myxococcoides]|uniref:glycosyltransferase n=1 Tax=Sporocytophaga myxococcoides TaxID=153721 RepID=UPI000410DD45|nr:glycosyltransferase [Sporocytophaga myxococcoides]
MGILTVLFIISAIIQAVYVLFVYARLWFYSENTKSGETVKVSVIVCARNAKENLAQLIPSLLKQKHPDFEIILVNDRSEDDTQEYIEKHFLQDSKFRFINVDSLPADWNGKKYALKQGINVAKGEIILLTDADCLPASEFWIKSITENFTSETSLVLGYSPYSKENTFLNKIIRYETVYTAMQYFSLSLAGMTYMGVGRNLAYRKHTLLESKSLDKYRSVQGGDDDLTVQEISKYSQTAIVTKKCSQTISIPKNTYKQWFKQKLRHLSVGKLYTPKSKLILGIFVMANLGFYASFLLLVYLESIHQIIIIVFILRTLLIISNFVLITRKLKDSLAWYWFPILDFFYYLNYLLVGISALFSRKIKWI